MDSDRHILSAVPHPITRTSHMPKWRDEGASVPKWREEDVPTRRFDASDEWDDKWLRPLFIMPPSQAPQSQPAKAENAPKRRVVEIPAKHADASAFIVPTSHVPPSVPTKTGKVRESLEPEAMPLKLRFLRRLFRDTQCRAKRYSTPDLVAYYFTGGAPTSFQVGDMSATGLYLLTPERWALCTLIQMTLQKKVGSGVSPKDSICVLSELVRFDENGVGFKFILPDYEYLYAYDLTPEEALDRKSLERFMLKIGVRAS